MHTRVPLGRWAPLGILLQLFLVGGLRAQVVISEFVAANDTRLTDSDREPSDWIELYNSGTGAVHLAGYFLTDASEQPEKWPLPDFELAADDFLVIFASGKDRRNPEGELHTNFRLSKSGEFLALIEPGGRVVSHYGTEYPPQVTDSSYGVSMVTGGTSLVDASAAVRYINPRDQGINTEWLTPGYDDSLWQSGVMPLGFDRNETPIYEDLIQTDVGDRVFEDNASLYVRIPFDLTEIPARRRLTLRLQYDDGFVAYLNGERLVRENISSVARSTSTARRERLPSAAREFATFQLPPQDGFLIGRNVLAIQIVNDQRSDPDLLLAAELATVVVESVELGEAGYFEPPTPAWPNGQVRPGVSPAVTASPPAGWYPEPFQVELTTTDPTAEIRYELDGSLPSTASPPYAGPFTLATNAVLVARAFSPGRIPGETTTTRYSVLDGGLADFSSNLPVFVLTTPAAPTTAWREMRVDLFEPPAGGRARLASASTFSGVGALKVRGSSTESRPKKGLTIEIQDEDGDDRAVPLLDLPADSDWILYAAFNFDHAQIRNAFIYQLGREVAVDANHHPGSYGVRTRFCEVFITRYGEPVSAPNYVGLYSLMEKIKQGPERVNVKKIDPDATEEPEVTGGYIIKIDRADPGDTGFSAGGQTLRYVEPKEDDIRANREQVIWLRDFIADMAGSIAGTGSEPLETLATHIDVQSWIDHSWLNILMMNVDAYRLSTYLHKDQGGKVIMGPVWDFDRSAGSTDGRDDDPTRWSGTGDGTNYFTYTWWTNLHRNESYVRLWETRWRELRRTLFSTEHIQALIDGMAVETAEAWVRDHERWGQGSTQDAAISNLKGWLKRRTDWIDGETVPRPLAQPAGGVVTPGLAVSLSIEGADLYYTLNGPDPAAGTEGGPAPEALLYSGETIAIDQPITLRARGFLEGVWSGLVEETYAPHTVPLVVTEVNFDPPRSPDAARSGNRFEFVELQNIGSETIDLTSLRFTDPVFSFEDTQQKTLAPGAYFLIVKDLLAFGERYDTTGLQIAGEFTGSLSNLRDTVEIVNANDELVFTFDYVGNWYALAREGHSLVIRNAGAPVETVNLRESWTTSAEPLGSPGRADEATVSTDGRRLVGDINSDARFNIVDVLALVEHIFRTPQDLPCDTADANAVLLDFDGDGALSIADPIRALGFLFREEAPPALGAGCQPIPGCSQRCET